MNQTVLVKARDLNVERFVRTRIICSDYRMVYFFSYKSYDMILLKDLNGDWVSKDGDYKALVFCQTRDHWRHHVLKRCKYVPSPDPPSDLFPDE